MKRKVIYTAANGKTYTKVFDGFIEGQAQFMQTLRSFGYQCAETSDAYIFTK